MNKITRVFFYVFCFSFPVFAMDTDDIPQLKDPGIPSLQTLCREKIKQQIQKDLDQIKVPSLKTLCSQKIIQQIQKDFDQIKWDTFIRVFSIENLDSETREMVLSHPFSFPKTFFKNEYICSSDEISRLAAPLTNINLGNLNLCNLLQHPDAISHRFEALVNRKALRSLNLSRNDLPPTFKLSFALSGLTTLNLETNRFKDFNLDNFPHLVNLNLSDNRLEEMPCHTYVDFTQIHLCLTALDVSDNYSLNLIDRVSRLTSLTTLNMGFCALRRVDDLTSLINLKTLNLTGNVLEQRVEGLTTLTNLTILNVAQTGANKRNLSPEQQATLLPLANKNVTIFFEKNDTSTWN